MSGIDPLIAALTTEFGLEVIFTPFLPLQITPPQVFLAPGDPFLEPGTHGLVVEQVRIVVAVSVKEPRAAHDEVRKLALRVRRACHSVGGFWTGADALAPLVTTNTQTVISANTVTLKYNPEGVTDG